MELLVASQSVDHAARPSWPCWWRQTDRQGTKEVWRSAFTGWQRARSGPGSRVASATFRSTPLNWQDDNALQCSRPHHHTTTRNDRSCNPYHLQPSLRDFVLPGNGRRLVLPLDSLKTDSLFRDDIPSVPNSVQCWTVRAVAVGFWMMLCLGSAVLRLLH